MRKATELQLHRFPADSTLILTLDPVDVLSHPRLGDGLGRYELDFAYRPYVNWALPASWWVLKIKRAFPSLMADIKRAELRLTAALIKAVNQVRRYKARIEDLAHANEARRALGGIPRDARLPVLIGGRPGRYRDVFYDLVRERAPDVSVVTYDNLFESRAAAISLLHS